MKHSIKKRLLLNTILVLITISAHAQNTWNGTTWSGGSEPNWGNLQENVVIDASLNITSSITVKNGSGITINAGIVNVSGSAEFSGRTPGSSLLVGSSADFNVAGDFTNKNSNSSSLTINGDMGVVGDLKNGLNGVITGGGSIDVGGTVTNSETIGGSTGNDVGTLPVELICFSGKEQDSGCILSWSTATELNNDGFEIQKSQNGKDYYQIG